MRFPTFQSTFLWENKTSFFEKQILKLNDDLIFNEAGDNLPQGTGDNVTVETQLLFNIPQSSHSPIPLSKQSGRSELHIYSAYISKIFILRS